MTLRIEDPSKWRGRPQLQGKPTTDGKVTYISGPKVGRWLWDSGNNELLSQLEANVYNAPLSTYDAIRAKRAELESSGKLTPAGVADELRKFGAIAKPTLEAAKQRLADARKQVESRKSKIKPTASDAAPDPARVMLKVEARAAIRGMSRREILNILAGNNPDPVFVEAILESDPRLTPTIGPALRKMLETTALEAKFGPEIEELAEIDQAIETASRALSTATEAIEREIRGESFQAQKPPMLVRAV